MRLNLTWNRKMMTAISCCHHAGDTHYFLGPPKLRTSFMPCGTWHLPINTNTQPKIERDSCGSRHSSTRPIAKTMLHVVWYLLMADADAKLKPLASKAASSTSATETKASQIT